MPNHTPNPSRPVTAVNHRDQMVTEAVVSAYIQEITRPLSPRQA